MNVYFFKYYIDGVEDKKIDIINVDIQDNKTIMSMAQTTSVVINCVGPYYIYGEAVVKSCILNSTHYVDVTGESLVSENIIFIVLSLLLPTYWFFFNQFQKC